MEGMVAGSGFLMAFGHRVMDWNYRYREVEYEGMGFGRPFVQRHPSWGLRTSRRHRLKDDLNALRWVGVSLQR